MHRRKTQGRQQMEGEQKETGGVLDKKVEASPGEKKHFAVLLVLDGAVTCVTLRLRKLLEPEGTQHPTLMTLSRINVPCSLLQLNLSRSYLISWIQKTGVPSLHSGSVESANMLPFIY